MLFATHVAALSYLVSNIPGGFLRSRWLKFLPSAWELRRRHCSRSTLKLKCISYVIDDESLSNMFLEESCVIICGKRAIGPKSGGPIGWLIGICRLHGYPANPRRHYTQCSNHTYNICYTHSANMSKSLVRPFKCSSCERPFTRQVMHPRSLYTLTARTTLTPYNRKTWSVMFRHVRLLIYSSQGRLKLLTQNADHPSAISRSYPCPQCDARFSRRYSSPAKMFER